MATERNKVILHGLLYGIQDWSVGFDLISDPPVSAFGDLVTWGTNINTWLAASLGSSLKTALGGESTLTETEVQYLQGPTLISSAHVPLDPVIPGSLSSSKNPPQLALVVSLRSVLAGPSHRGRSYWPWCSTPVGTNGKLSSATVSTFLSQYGLLMHGIESSAPAGTSSVHVMIYSPKLDVLTEISSIQAGDVVDTQRRRRNDFNELRQVEPYV